MSNFKELLNGMLESFKPCDEEDDFDSFSVNSQNGPSDEPAAEVVEHRDNPFRRSRNTQSEAQEYSDSFSMGISHSTQPEPTQTPVRSAAPRRSAPVDITGGAVSASSRGGSDYSVGAQGSSRVMNIQTTTAVQVVIARPVRFEQAVEVANQLRDKRTVLINLETTPKDVSRRVLDFLSGVAYANGGNIKKVAVNTFIITPYNVNIVGDLIDEMEKNGVRI